MVFIGIWILSIRPSVCLHCCVNLALWECEHLVSFSPRSTKGVVNNADEVRLMSPPSEGRRVIPTDRACVLVRLQSVKRAPKSQRLSNLVGMSLQQNKTNVSHYDRAFFYPQNRQQQRLRDPFLMASYTNALNWFKLHLKPTLMISYMTHSIEAVSGKTMTKEELNKRDYFWQVCERSSKMSTSRWPTVRQFDLLPARQTDLLPWQPRSQPGVRSSAWQWTLLCADTVHAKRQPPVSSSTWTQTSLWRKDVLYRRRDTSWSAVSETPVRASRGPVEQVQPTVCWLQTWLVLHQLLPKAGCVRLCRVASNIVWSHMASDTL